MRTYILENRKTGKRYGPFTVKDKDELRKSVFGKIPDGYYNMIAKTGNKVGEVKIDEKQAKRRPQLSKAEYDELYYYVEPGAYESYYLKGKSPLSVTSTRRYDTIDEVRKAALAKSQKLYQTAKWRMEMFGRADPYYVAVFKGTKFLGTVEYDLLKTNPGLWMSAQHPKDPQPLKKDGTIGGKNAVRVIRRN